MEILAQDSNKQHPAGLAKLALADYFELKKHKEKLNFCYQEKN